MAGHLAALDEYLRSAPPLHSLTVPPGGGGHAAKVGIALEGGGAVLAKLDSGAPYEGEMIRREAAAWVVACAMGWPDLMPATVLRSVDWQGRHYEASVQMLWPHVIQPPPRVVDFGYGERFRPIETTTGWVSQTSLAISASNWSTMECRSVSLTCRSNRPSSTATRATTSTQAISNRCVPYLAPLRSSARSSGTRRWRTKRQVGRRPFWKQVALSGSEGPLQWAPTGVGLDCRWVPRGS
jgi:hypothetical protein